MTIVVLKLATSEEIICTVDDEGLDLQADSVVVSDPAMIIMQPNSDGRVSIGLAPYCPYAKKKRITIMRSGIVATMEVEGEMENEYRRIFGSGIVVANSSKIAL